MNKWISVKDRLPANNSIVIASTYSHYKCLKFVEPLYYIDEKWITMDHDEQLDMEYQVTHWIPLPDPPE